MGLTKLLAAGASVLALSACNTVQQAWNDRQGAYTRNLPDLSDDDARKFALRQNNLWNCFVSMARANPESRYDTNLPESYDCPNAGAAPNVIKTGETTMAPADAAIPQAMSPVPPAKPKKGDSDADVETLDAQADAGEEPPAKDEPVYPLYREPTLQARYDRPIGVAGTQPAYSEVVAAGINYVDVRCDRYMDALFYFNRIRETASRQVQFAGAASAAALTILKASTELIGLAPLGIGFVDQTINNVGRGLLYDLPPHIVRQLVEKQQQAYLKAVAKEYTSRPHAMQTIQGYAALCLPATIETEVNRAIAAAEYKPTAWENPLRRTEWGNNPPGKEDGKPDALTTTEGTPPPNHVPSVEQTKVDD